MWKTCKTLYVKKPEKKYPDDQLFWIIGEDQLENLHKWKDIEELKNTISALMQETRGK